MVFAMQGLPSAFEPSPALAARFHCTWQNLNGHAGEESDWDASRKSPPLLTPSVPPARARLMPLVPLGRSPPRAQEPQRVPCPPRWRRPPPLEGAAEYGHVVLVHGATADALQDHVLEAVDG
eukprot:CAMPEP_0177223000 /NCGR_PEP_ID=MMETSP0367-20130122/38240_1 /TAXON_ID=447022 ORGANISM="Scrippsiella hangoei-like, Strain SHHI-4" /NCGR_SAMPLE_ID=MMETSP0367 /ASSEMBLY_ACC=CAM_ASM_000362 /LENGTH=121 /DNA_ID=CAMNT_0018672919 /DNA_START=337 /DNA_END=701 /DNA_ORIENTATION=+